MTHRSRWSDVPDVDARVRRDAAAVAVLAVGLVVGIATGALPEMLDRLSRAVPWLHLPAVLLFLALSHLVMLVFGARRSRDLRDQASRRTGAERALRHRAEHDDLTGLLGRTAFGARLESVLAGEAPSAPLAVAMVDVQRFAEVNDVLGHAAGDVLLQILAERCRAELCTPGGGVELARFGADQIAVLLPGVGAERARVLLEGLLVALRRPADVHGLVLEVEVSVGVAVGAGRERSAAWLLRGAEAALRDAKTERAGVVVHGGDASGSDRDRLLLLGELRHGIHEGQLVVHYQPQLCIASGVVVGVEALVRWQHPRRGLLAPGEFIALAEHSALVRDLTDAVLTRALDDVSGPLIGDANLSVAVNLSARCLLDDTLPQRVQALLVAHGLRPDRLELEITESAAMRDPRRALVILERLRAVGVRLSIDDFGTGHASLTYLTDLPVDSVKVDRSFVSGLDHDARGLAVVEATVALAHRLGLTVVAEGVEERAEWLALEAMGCDQAQGFLLGRPMPVEALARRLADDRRRAALAPS